METASWTEWWRFATQLLVSDNSFEEAKCYRLFLMGSGTLMMMARTVLVLWVNLALKGHDVGLRSSHVSIEWKCKMPLSLT